MLSAVKISLLAMLIATGCATDPQPGQRGPEARTSFRWIPPRTFKLGTPKNHPMNNGTENELTVKIAEGFWMSDHEVTQQEYEKVMGNNPSYFKGPNHPVENVRWEEAVKYCEKLTQQERAAGRIAADHEYRLPSEAEWELAARAGTTTHLHSNLNEISWNKTNSDNRTHPVKQKLPNEWGLYDMFGNVWELCSDHRWEYEEISMRNPNKIEDKRFRTIRGGDYHGDERMLRPAKRWIFEVDDRAEWVGFRLSFGKTRKIQTPK